MSTRHTRSNNSSTHLSTASAHAASSTVNLPPVTVAKSAPHHGKGAGRRAVLKSKASGEPIATPELTAEAPIQRKSKAATLGKKVWNAVAPRGSRKRTHSDATVNGGAPVAKKKVKGNEAQHLSKPSAGGSEALPLGPPAASSGTARKAPKPRPVVSKRIKSTNAAIENDAQPSNGGDEPKATATRRSVRTTKVGSPHQTFIHPNDVEVLDSEGEGDQGAPGETISDESDDAADFGSDDNVYESEDDLQMDEDQLRDYLEAEQPSWNDRSELDLKSSRKGKAKATVWNNIPSLHLSDMESNGSDSEYRPDDEGGEGEDKVVEDDADASDFLAEMSASAKRPHKNRANAGTHLTSRQQLEQPVWRGEEAWENTARGPAVAGPSSGQLPQVVRPTPPPGPASLFPDHDDDTRSVSDGEGDAFNDHTQTPPLVQVPPPVAAPGVVALPTAGIPNVLPATTYAIVPPAQVGRVLSLTAQHPHIVHTLRATFIKIEADLAFLDAFPDGLGRTLFVTNAMDAAAAGLGHTGLQERFRADRPFLRILSALPKQRISTFRGTVKRHSDAHVVAHYGILPGKCSDKITFLFDNLVYVYPHSYESGGSKKTVAWARPYHNDAVSSILRAAFFTGTTSIAARYINRFTSVLPQRPDEKEIPMAMLALVGAAIHASLSEWRSGAYKPTSFSADAYLDAYNEHLTLLNGIKEASVRGYHNIMHRLYNEASGSSAGVTTLTGAGNPLAHVDFAGMDVD